MNDRRMAWIFVAPAVAVIALTAAFPILWTAWESLHRHDLNMPWTGRPFLGLGNYLEIIGDGRFRSALAHTALFAAVSVTLELLAGLAVALAIDTVSRGRGLTRAAVLLPWSIPTVVAALLFRFLFDSQSGPFGGLGVVWLADAKAAWVPIILADVWKTTPFVALLLLAGLQTIPRELHEAAEVDGASPWRRLILITLPLLRPAIVVALIFRTLDAFRVFDLIYVLTGGGPGSATEPIALYTFDALFQNLRSGYAAALSMVVFAITFLLAVLYVRVLDPRREQ